MSFYRIGLLCANLEKRIMWPVRCLRSHRLLWGGSLILLLCESCSTTRIKVLRVFKVLEIWNKLCLVLQQSFKVHVEKPRMAANLGSSVGILLLDVGPKPLSRVHCHQLIHKVDGLGGRQFLDLVGPIDSSMKNIVENLIRCGSIEWWIAKEEFKHDTSQRPPVTHLILA